MRGSLTRPEAALAALTGLVLAGGATAALTLADDGGGAPAGAGSTRSPAPEAASSPSPSSTRSPSPSAAPTPAATTTSPLPRPSPTGAGVAPSASGTPAPSAPPAVRGEPDPVAVAFFDAAVQGRDADALAVADAQVLSDLREYADWDRHRFTGCEPEKDHSVCLLETDSTFLRLILVPDPSTGWRVAAVE